MRKDLQKIRNQLKDIAETEATKLFRLAWRMQDHGCKPENIEKCRLEAWLLRIGRPEGVLDRRNDWQYAFKW